MRVQLKVKSNGHHICTKLLKKQSILAQLQYHITKYKFPITLTLSNIQIESHSNSMINSSFAHTIRQQNEEEYDINVLAQQVTLFQSYRQIEDYIATEKLLANDVEEKLGKLCKALILVANQQFLRKREFVGIIDHSEIQAKNITKEQLNQIQQKCMQTLARVQEERKKLDLCVICWENMTNCIILPCMHMVMCSKCPKTKACPVCKSTVKSTQVVYR